MISLTGAKVRAYVRYKMYLMSSEPRPKTFPAASHRDFQSAAATTRRGVPLFTSLTSTRRCRRVNYYQLVGVDDRRRVTIGKRIPTRSSRETETARLASGIRTMQIVVMASKIGSVGVVRTVNSDSERRDEAAFRAP